MEHLRGIQPPVLKKVIIMIGIFSSYERGIMNEEQIMDYLLAKETELWNKLETEEKEHGEESLEYVVAIVAWTTVYDILTDLGVSMYELELNSRDN
jgi:hypothetical protein